MHAIYILKKDYDQTVPWSEEAQGFFQAHCMKKEFGVLFLGYHFLTPEIAKEFCNLIQLHKKKSVY